MYKKRWKEKRRFQQVLFFLLLPSSTATEVSPIINQASISIWSNCRVIGLLSERTVNTAKQKKLRVKVIQGKRRQKKQTREPFISFLIFAIFCSFFLFSSEKHLILLAIHWCLHHLYFLTMYTWTSFSWSVTMYYTLGQECNDLFQVKGWKTNYGNTRCNIDIFFLPHIWWMPFLVSKFNSFQVIWPTRRWSQNHLHHSKRKREEKW